ncbi:type VI secretion system Vgr family protein [Entomomonas asaccharolytica]|uniref:Type VI secretion system tip protein VgrG n=1 Tax=Entomomonas asaccharolytica TaxID=2785331 RepID=A0A974NGA5_9GAMM|nr:type VI secretion system tip protein TssI/VgrG [Entomomonas asaccharolytica]QQP86039.1 type VI secretion system tip protein VgrG [Entomomonas asaccharolytica]
MFSPANEVHYTLDVGGLGNSGLQVLSFDGIEGINAEYAFEITLVHNHLRFDITQLLSKPAYLSFNSDKSQGVHGVIHSVKRGAVGNHYAQFKVILAPKFSHLYKRVNQRRWVEKTVPQIITSILTEHGMQEGDKNGFAYKLKETYEPREFCVQYDENDADFIHRLCEEEGWGISYAFTNSSHQMVFTDAQPFLPSLAEAIHYASDTGFVADYPVIKRFDINLSSATKTASYRNYNFTNMKIPEGTAEGLLSKKANDATEPNLESYDYPNPHLNKAKADHYSKIEIERLRASHILAEALSDIPTLHAGYFFSVNDYPQLDTLDTTQPWLVKQIRHQARQPQVLEAWGGEGSASTTTLEIIQQTLQKYFRHPIAEELEFPYEDYKQGYRNCLVATPQEVTYRPARLHKKPQVLGSQTAIVTGPAGEEIYCDEYGRVKVQFHWDREGNYDENSSYWVRVASNWAHDGYGTVVIPRVGMEVLINYLEGDPDQPVISGAVHNGVNKVPYDLPANKTRSVFKTSSSKGGIGSNELRIEDKAGEEQIFVQAQKDFDQLTKNNHTIQVLNNSHLQVQNEHSETIVKNRYTKNEAEEHHLTQLDRKTQILMNDHKTVGMSEHETIGTIKTTEAGMEIHLKSGLQTIIDGGLSLTLKAGGQHIVLNPAGIWMTMPQFTGGVPMEGAPAAPLLPMNIEKTVAPSLGPILGSGMPFVQMCQKPQGGSPADCPLSNCPCRAKLLG